MLCAEGIFAAALFIAPQHVIVRHEGFKSGVSESVEADHIGPE